MYTTSNKNRAVIDMLDRFFKEIDNQDNEKIQLIKKEMTEYNHNSLELSEKHREYIKNALNIIYIFEHVQEGDENHDIVHSLAERVCKSLNTSSFWSIIQIKTSINILAHLPNYKDIVKMFYRTIGKLKKHRKNSDYSHMEAATYKNATLGLLKLKYRIEDVWEQNSDAGVMFLNIINKAISVFKNARLQNVVTHMEIRKCLGNENLRQANGLLSTLKKEADEQFYKSVLHEVEVHKRETKHKHSPIKTSYTDIDIQEIKEKILSDKLVENMNKHEFKDVNVKFVVNRINEMLLENNLFAANLSARIQKYDGFINRIQNQNIIPDVANITDISFAFSIPVAHFFNETYVNNSKEQQSLEDITKINSAKSLGSLKEILENLSLPYI